MRIDNPIGPQASLTGSFSGSFVGDGSGLIGAGGGAGIFAATGSSYNTTNNLEISGSLKTTGNVTVGGTLTEVSTRELKDSIILLSDQLPNVERLEPVSFVWKGTQEEDIGFIAEDVEEIYPVLVTKSVDGKVEGLHYTKLTSILVKAVQELSDRVKALEDKIKD